jgi:uncharacterized protein YraI
VPQISVDENTHCRSGPGAVYPSKGVLLVGEVAIHLKECFLLGK